MFCRISAMFRCHVLHIFYAADSLRLTHYATNGEAVVASVAEVVEPRVHVAAAVGHIQRARVVQRVYRRGPPDAVVAAHDAACVIPSKP